MGNNPVELALFLRSCATCGTEFGTGDGRRAHCSDACAKASKARHRRQRQTAYRVTHTLQELCRQTLKNAVNRGVVRRAARCEECGDLEFTEGHHHDYRKPFFVEWLCKACHAGRGVGPHPDQSQREHEEAHA